jgi:nickel/cobalt transporter (NicO) family protein
VPGRGTAVRSSVSVHDPTRGLTSYPEALLRTPPDVREATLHVRPGTGTVAGPGAAAPGGGRAAEAGDGFAGILAGGDGVLALLLLTAFAWGALHALSPGHGKAMVAAYLVGTHGRPRDAVVLGITVTITHTIGVFALGVVTLALSQYVLPEDLYPWLNLVAGLLVVAIGAGVLRSRIRWARAGGAKRQSREAADGGAHGPGPAHAGHGHGPSHPHAAHAQAAGHSHGAGHTHAGHAHGLHSHPGHSDPHPHPPGAGPAVTRRSIIGLGAAAGMIPCPSALVVLLAAVSQHEVALGMLLIVAFSLGLAGTLTALGLAVVYAGRLIPRFSAPGRGTIGRAVTALPAASAVVIVGVGAVLTVNALPALV